MVKNGFQCTGACTFMAIAVWRGKYAGLGAFPPDPETGRKRQTQQTGFDRLGIPIFAMDWKDPVSGEVISGFREKGFLPEAFVNMLAVLGWNDGTEQELYSIAELIEKFSIERVHKAGAKFNYEKAKWFNQEWIREVPPEELQLLKCRKIYSEQGLQIPDEAFLLSVISLLRDRCHLLPEFYDQGKFFFEAPSTVGSGCH